MGKRYDRETEFLTRSMAQKGTFGTSGTVSATAEPTVMVQLPTCGNAKCECKCKARSVDSGPSTRVCRAQDALRAQMMVGECARNPTKKGGEQKRFEQFYFVE